MKDGYVPQEEMPLYESKGKQWAKSQDNRLPPGLTPEMAERMKNAAKGTGLIQWASGGLTANSSETTNPKKCPKMLATGLLVEDEWIVPAAQKKKNKKKAGAIASDNHVQEVTHQLNNTKINSKMRKKMAL